MISVTVGDYVLQSKHDGLPAHYSQYTKKASLIEEIDVKESEGSPFFWPSLKARNGRSSWSH